MERSDELNDRIEAYLSGTMTEDQKADFETMLVNDPELKAEVDREQRMLLAIELLKYKRTFAKQQTIPIRKEPTLKIFEWKRYAVAASIAVFLLTGILYKAGVFTTQSRLAYEKYYEPETYARGGCPQDLPAFQLYANGKYKDALQEVDTITGDSSSCISYFKGLCYLAMDQSSLAIPLLVEACASSEAEVLRKAQWYLTMAYLEAGQPKEARQILTEMAATPGHPYQKAAREIISDFFSE